MSIAVIASQLGIVACPISAATVSLLAMLSDSGVQLGDILVVTIPATFGGIFLGALVMTRYGKPLAPQSGRSSGGVNRNSPFSAARILASRP